MNIKYKKRFVTLIEMMIVMFLIALITGVIAYNYRGSLEEGKAFKTQAGIEKLTTILNLEIARSPDSLNNITTEWPNIVRTSPMVQNADALIKDGWGFPYRVEVSDGVVTVHSDRYDDYSRTHRTMFGDNPQQTQ